MMLSFKKKAFLFIDRHIFHSFCLAVCIFALILFKRRNINLFEDKISLRSVLKQNENEMKKHNFILKIQFFNQISAMMKITGKIINKSLKSDIIKQQTICALYSNSKLCNKHN